jgi:hypothetical protein
MDLEGTEARNDCAGETSSNLPNRLTDVAGRQVGSHVQGITDLSWQFESAVLEL